MWIFLLLLGWFRLGNLVRFIPYPVVGGFLAGIGWLLMKGGLGITTGMSFYLGQLPQFLEGPVLTKWVPGLLFAVFLMALMARSKHFLTLPVTLLLAVALFHMTLLVLGIPLSEAKADGWLLGPFPEGSLWEPLTPSSLSGIHWSVLPTQAGSMAAIALMAAVSLLLNSSGLELALRKDIDLNRELNGNGIANVAAGLCSGPAGFTTLSLSVLGPRLGTHSRAIGIVSSLVAGGVCPQSKHRQKTNYTFSRCALDSLEEFLLSPVPKQEATPGAVIAIQTFGDFLNFSPHCHVLCTDGTFYGSRAFKVASALDTKPLEKLFQHRVLRMLLRKGKITEEVVKLILSWRHSGFNVHCGPRIQPGDQDALENIARYVVRASFSQERMTYVPDEAKVGHL